MASINRVMILGNLGADPDMRYTQNQTPVVTLSVATTDYRMVEGQRQEQTEWHRVTVWGKQAENCKKYLAKGRSVFVEGRLQTRSWDDKTTGQKRYTTEIVASSVQFVGGASKGSYETQSYEQSGASSFSGGSESAGSTTFNYGEPSTPSFDDIPF